MLKVNFDFKHTHVILFLNIIDFKHLSLSVILYSLNELQKLFVAFRGYASVRPFVIFPISAECDTSDVS
jgi:hypothetical protein